MIKNSDLAFSFALAAIGFACVFARVFLERRRRAFSGFVELLYLKLCPALRPPRAPSLNN